MSNYLRVLYGHPRYAPTRVIDVSGSAFVLEAEDRNHGNDKVAVKCFQNNAVNPAINPARIYRGFCVHARMKHPCIIAPREVFNAPNHVCLAMEYVPGPNMKQHVQEYRARHGQDLPVATAGRIFFQVVDAIRLIHLNGAVYRSLKPEHVLLCSDGMSVKICDFLFARFGLDSPSQVGSLHYMPPEFFADEAQAGQNVPDGRKVDVWECGVFLYFLLYGTLPFTVPDNMPEGQGMAMLIDSILHAPVQFPERDGVSAQCRALLTAMLVRNPVDRISMQGIAEDHWYLEHQYVPEHQPPQLGMHQTAEMIKNVITEAVINDMDM